MEELNEFRLALQGFMRSISKGSKVLTPSGHELHPTQCHILGYLKKNNGSTDQTTIADYLNINKSNITRSCESLEKLGYIIRKKSDTDKRVINLKLTPKGKVTIEKMMLNTNKWMTDYLKNFSVSERKVITRALKKLTEVTQKNNS
jgi:DNA-binding MarR family transcriptional regulator